MTAGTGCKIGCMPRRALLFLIAALVAAAAPAPNFTAKTLDGQKFTNVSLKGKVVLIQFWTTWCQYCRREQPVVDALTGEYVKKGLVVLAVNAGESRKTVKNYLGKSPRACNIVLMEDTNLAAMFEAKSYPLYVLIDREGNIAGTQEGAGGEEALRELLEKAGLKD